MVDTIKFSQFVDAGDLQPNEVTVGVNAGANARYNNPFPLLSPGTTAQRPPVDPIMYYRLRFNTTLQVYEYYSPIVGDWVQLVDSAPILAGPYVTYTADPTIPNAFDLGLLTSGLLKQTVSTGISTPAIAVLNTDYYGPGMNPLPIAEGGTAASTAAGARINLGLGTIAVQDANNVAITGGFANLTAGQVIASPTLSTDLVNKAYADAIAGGFTFKAACFCATTANLSTTYNNGSSGVGATLTATGNGVLTIDGTNPSITQRVLVKDQTAPAQNGIYVVSDTGSVSTPYVLTRATDFDSAANIVAGSIVFVTDGSTNADKSWIETNSVITVGTDPIIWIQFSQQYPLSMGLGGTGAALTPSNGSLVYSNATNMALLATLASGVLVTDGSGLPSISTTLPAGLTIPGYAHSGANSDITSMSGLTGLLRAPTGIADSSSNILLGFTYAGSAVNHLNIGNSATTSPVFLQADGSDTNIAIQYVTKGIGSHNFYTNATSGQLLFLSGPAYNHTTQFNFPNSAASRTITYQDASGTLAFLGDQGMTLIASAVASNSATIDFTNLTGYSNYLFVFHDVVPATNGASMTVLASTNNGSSYITTANYFAVALTLVGTSSAVGTSLVQTGIIPTSTQITGTGNGWNGDLLFTGFGSSVRKGYLSRNCYFNTGGNLIYLQASGYLDILSPINAIRFIYTSGNIASGEIYCYGLK